jgi:hypothetical protein
LKIQKRKLGVKGILEQDLGFVGGPSQRGFGGSGGFRVEVERGRFPRFAEVRQVFLRLIRAHRLLPPGILIFTTGCKHPRIVGATRKVIITKWSFPDLVDTPKKFRYRKKDG